MTLEDVCGRVTDMAADILAILHMGFDTVMDMYWEDLSLWHRKAVSVRKRMFGVS